MAAPDGLAQVNLGQRIRNLAPTAYNTAMTAAMQTLVDAQAGLDKSNAELLAGYEQGRVTQIGGNDADWAANLGGDALALADTVNSQAGTSWPSVDRHGHGELRHHARRADRVAGGPGGQRSGDLCHQHRQRRRPTAGTRRKPGAASHPLAAGHGRRPGGLVSRGRGLRAAGCQLTTAAELQRRPRR